MAMIAITTNNSIKVNATCLRFMVFLNGLRQQ
jgi:hypothetical protein